MSDFEGKSTTSKMQTDTAKIDVSMGESPKQDQNMTQCGESEVIFISACSPTLPNRKYQYSYAAFPDEKDSTANLCHIAAAMRLLSFLTWPPDTFFKHFAHYLLRGAAQGYKFASNEWTPFVVSALQTFVNANEEPRGQQDALDTLQRISLQLWPAILSDMGVKWLEKLECGHCPHHSTKINNPIVHLCAFHCDDKDSTSTPFFIQQLQSSVTDQKCISGYSCPACHSADGKGNESGKLHQTDELVTLPKRFLVQTVNATRGGAVNSNVNNILGAKFIARYASKETEVMVIAALVYLTAPEGHKSRNFSGHFCTVELAKSGKLIYDGQSGTLTGDNFNFDNIHAVVCAPFHQGTLPSYGPCHTLLGGLPTDIAELHVEPVLKKPKIRNEELSRKPGSVQQLIEQAASRI